MTGIRSASTPPAPKPTTPPNPATTVTERTGEPEHLAIHFPT